MSLSPFEFVEMKDLQYKGRFLTRRRSPLLHSAHRNLGISAFVLAFCRWSTNFGRLSVVYSEI